MRDKLQTLIDFVSFTHEIREVERAMWVKGQERFENDSEHGYQLAMVALYLIDTEELALDMYKTMAMAVVHDIIEVYSGDTPIFGSVTDRATKDDREMAARLELKRRWPHLVRLHGLIDEYEARTTPEATFVYALDKLVPMINNYLDNGRNWNRQGATFDHVWAAKVGKIDIDETIKAYYEPLVAALRAHPEMFAK